LNQFDVDRSRVADTNRAARGNSQSRASAPPAIVSTGIGNRQINDLLTGGQDGLSAVREVLDSGTGSPLPVGVRHSMEQRFQTDFTDVRLHTGKEAADSAAQIGARAYTVGKHVVLSVGLAQGDSLNRTLAHELAHVAQQVGRPGRMPADGLTVSHPADPREREATDVATDLTRDGRVLPSPGQPVRTTAAPNEVMRQGGKPAPTSVPSSGPATSPASAPATEPAATDKTKDAEGWQAEFQPIFDRLFRGYAPRSAFAARRIAIIPDALGPTYSRVIETEAEDHLRRLMKMAPEVVRGRLQGMYRIDGLPLPPEYAKDFGEKTTLRPEDRKLLLALIRAGDLRELMDPTVGGMYSMGAKSIFIKTSSASQGAVIHEMAHGCASENWNDVIAMLIAEGKTNVDKLNEGMTCLIADRVASDWALAKPGRTSPATGYESDNSYRDAAHRFIDDVGERAAFRAYFAGALWPDDKDDAFLHMGDPANRSEPGTRIWRWPW
jgi:hypothetical protein